MRPTLRRAASSARALARKAFPTNSLAAALISLRERGVPLDTFYDIGAHRGAFATDMKRFLPRSRFVLFEANETMKPALAASGFPYFIRTLSSRSGTVEFYQRDGTGDSYYKEATDRYVSVPANVKPCTTLDEVVTTEHLPLPNLIKLDTQGSELDILEGAPRARAHTALVYMETPIFRYNLGAPDMGAYLARMSEWGFVASGVHEVNTRYDVLIQIDILFIKKDVLMMISPEASKFYTFSGEH